jgi:hypothetical protein
MNVHLTYSIHCIIDGKETWLAWYAANEEKAEHDVKELYP